MRDSPIDRIIDETARSLTDVDVPPRLRAHVRQRLNERRHRAAGMSIWRGAAVASAVAVAWLAWTGWPLDERPSMNESGGRRGAAVAPPAATVPEPRDTRTSAPEARAGERPPVSPLPPPAPIVVAPVVVTPLAAELAGPDVSLQVEPIARPMPLQAERLELEPLAFQ